MPRARPKIIVPILILGVLAALALTACAREEPPSTTPGTAAGAGQATPGATSADTGSVPVTAGPAPEPAAPGMTLGELSTPPARSLWALSTESYDADVEVEVEFQPYGVGPSSFGPSIVALVTFSADGNGQRVPELAGRNVVFILGDTSVSVGGHYAGTAVTRLQDDRIVFVLTQASLLPE